MSSHENDAHGAAAAEPDMDELLAVEDAAGEIFDTEGALPDADSDTEELVLHNDSVAYFDEPRDSLFAIAQHPVHPALVAIGGSGGSAEDAPGAGWLLDTSAAPTRPILPASYAQEPPKPPTSLPSLFPLEGHTDSINTLAWTLPRGDVLLSGGLDGQLRAWRAEAKAAEGIRLTFLGEAQEVEEVNWLAACPTSSAVALGAPDGSVWVYNVDSSDVTSPLQIVQSYFLHTASCTAGAWTPDGQLLATVAEDSSLYVWDVWGQAATQGMVRDNGMTVVSKTGEDQRFEVEGGLYSVAIDPKAAFVAVGGASGAIRIVSLPRLPSPNSKRSADLSPGGQLLASLQTQSDSVEALAVTHITTTTPLTTLLAAGSVDGSIAVFDASRRFAERRHITTDHGAVIQLAFVPADPWLLTSCGLDGVVRRWDLRAGGAAADAGLLREWRGHRGRDGCGVLGFVQDETGERLVTVGDDGLALVFNA